MRDYKFLSIKIVLFILFIGLFFTDKYFKGFSDSGL